METHHFWAFFVIALIAGGAITLGVSNATMTGHAVQAQVEQNIFQRIFGIKSQPIKTCTDTDGGIDHYVKGSCTECVGNVCVVPRPDTCYGNVLTEWYCEGTNCRSIDHTCPDDCEDGACIGAGQGLWARGSGGGPSGDYIYPINDPNFKIMDEDPHSSPDIWMGKVDVDFLDVEEILSVEEGIIYEGEPENVHGLATYEGILEMLNKCTIQELHEETDCNMVCESRNAGKCISASAMIYMKDYPWIDQWVLTPVECNTNNTAFSAGNQNPYVHDFVWVCTCCLL